MKTKILSFAILIFSFALFSSGFIYSGISISDVKKYQTECPYIQGKSEKFCPYLEEKINKQNLECPYTSGKSKCPYSGKDSKTDAETSSKEKNKEIKFYKTLKNIST